MSNRSRVLWRWLLVCAVLALAIVPAVPLVASTINHASARPLWTPSFVVALRSTLQLGAGVAVVSFLLGLPAGLLVTLYQFPGRSLLFLLQILPLLLPSFLLCIGWSNLAAAHVVPFLAAPTGLTGCAFVLGVQAVPLPLLATWAACHNLTNSQIEAARLHGGERAVLTMSAKACTPPALLAALFGGIISLSDPGAPLILGCRSLAVEVRTSFAALFDYDLASRQCLLLAGVVLLLTVPILVFGLRYLAAAVLARQTHPVQPHGTAPLRWVATLILTTILLVGIVLPAIGLCLPAVRDPMFGRAWHKVVRTAATTAVFTGGAGAIAVSLALLIGMNTASDRRLRFTVLVVLLALLAMPPALSAIGMLRLAAKSPPNWDWLLRGQTIVAAVLGLRLLPVAAVAMMRAIGSLSPSWIEAAHLHGVRPSRLLFQVILPRLAPAILIGFLLVAVLAAADISTTHLLQPPGKQSFPVAIFTVMANSPEGLVASLCLIDLLVVTGLLLAGAWLGRLSRRYRA